MAEQAPPEPPEDFGCQVCLDAGNSCSIKTPASKPAKTKSVLAPITHSDLCKAQGVSLLPGKKPQGLAARRHCAIWCSGESQAPSPAFYK